MSMNVDQLPFLGLRHSRCAFLRKKMEALDRKRRSVGRDLLEQLPLGSRESLFPRTLFEGSNEPNGIFCYDA